MGSSGESPSLGDQTLTSTSTTSLPKWVIPYAQRFLSGYNGLVFNSDGSVKQMPSSLNQNVVPFNQNQKNALQMITGTTPLSGQLAGGGAQSLYSTLAGQYLNPQTNPYLDATYQAAAKPMVQQYQFATAPGNMAAAQHAGQMGGSAYNETNLLNQYGLGSNLSDLAANIYGGNYQAERGRQAGAQAYLPGTTANMYAPAQNLLGAGAYQQQQDQYAENTRFGNALRSQEYPFALLSGFGGALGQASGGTGSSSSTSTIPSAFVNPVGGMGGGLNPAIPYGLLGASALGPVLSGLGSLAGSGK
jgi:hypothetical protein